MDTHYSMEGDSEAATDCDLEGERQPGQEEFGNNENKMKREIWKLGV